MPFNYISAGADGPQAKSACGPFLRSVRTGAAKQTGARLAILGMTGLRPSGDSAGRFSTWLKNLGKHRINPRLYRFIQCIVDFFVENVENLSVLQTVYLKRHKTYRRLPGCFDKQEKKLNEAFACGRLCRRIEGCPVRRQIPGVDLRSNCRERKGQNL